MSFVNLPFDVFHEILSHLPFRNGYHLLLTCKTLHELLLQSGTWRQWYLAMWGRTMQYMGHKRLQRQENPQEMKEEEVKEEEDDDSDWRTLFLKRYGYDSNWKKKKYSVTTVKFPQMCTLITALTKQHLLTCSEEGTIEIHDFQANKKLVVLKVAAKVLWWWKVIDDYCVCVSQDSVLAVVRFSVPGARVVNSSAVFSPSFLTAISSGTISGGKETLTLLRKRSLSGGLWCVDVDPERDLAVCGSGGGEIFILKFSTLEILHHVRTDPSKRFFDLILVGNHIWLSSTSSVIIQVNVTTGAVLENLSENSARKNQKNNELVTEQMVTGFFLITTKQFGVPKDYILTSDYAGNISAWDLATNKITWSLTTPSPNISEVLVFGGKIYAASNDEDVRVFVWDFFTRELLYDVHIRLELSRIYQLNVTEDKLYLAAGEILIIVDANGNTMHYSKKPAILSHDDVESDSD